jgi:hypothetical protein
MIERCGGFSLKRSWSKEQVLGTFKACGSCGHDLAKNTLAQCKRHIAGDDPDSRRQDDAIGQTSQQRILITRRRDGAGLGADRILGR